MNEIKKIEAQIWAINKRLDEIQDKSSQNYFKAKNKIKTLKEKHSILLNKYNWDQFLSK